MHGHPQFRRNADTRPDFVAERDGKDKVRAGNGEAFARRQGCRNHVDTGMAARILIAFVEFQHRARGAVEQARKQRTHAAASPNHRNLTITCLALRKARNEVAHFRLLHSGCNGTDAVEEHELRALDHGCWQISEPSVGCEPAPLLEPLRLSVLQQDGCGNDVLRDDRHEVFSVTCRDRRASVRGRCGPVRQNPTGR